MNDNTPSDWPIGDLEPIVSNLKASVAIFGHLITASKHGQSKLANGARWRTI